MYITTGVDYDDPSVIMERNQAIQQIEALLAKPRRKWKKEELADAMDSVRHMGAFLGCVRSGVTSENLKAELTHDEQIDGDSMEIEEATHSTVSDSQINALIKFMKGKAK